MRKFFKIGGFISTLLIINTLFLCAQSQEVDVIYLKTGKTISGKIVERIPDKTVVIETKDGIEFVDYVDIKRIQQEFIPKIEGITPNSGIAGATVSLNGSFPATQPKDAAVFFGEVEADILLWGKSKIEVTVPELTPKDYIITLKAGNQKDIARIAYTVTTVTAKIDRARLQKRIAQKEVAQVVEEEGYNTGGFWGNIAYTIPRGDFKNTSGPKGSYPKTGPGFGFEGRIHLSQNFFIPINFHATTLSYNIDELQKQYPVPISSEGKSHGLIWFTSGLGFALPLSSSTFIFISSDFGPTMVHRPDLKIGTTSYYSYNSVNTFTTGYGFSSGITFADDFTFGYRIFSAKPKHKIQISSSNLIQTFEVEVEEQVQVGQIFIMFAW
jgi:hypothetical protein